MKTKLEEHRGRVVEQPARSRMPAHGVNGNDNDKDLKDQLALWQLLESIAQCQGKVWLNWHQWWPKFVLAPTTNLQEIMSRWVVGNQVNIYKSSDPGLEETVRSRVAGYGSQLGTILDYLERVQEDLRLKTTNAKDPNDAVNKLNTLIAQVKAAKKMYGRG